MLGCGSGDEDAAAPSAAAVELAERCDLPSPLPGSPPDDLLPPGLLPDEATVLRWGGEGLNARARVAFEVPLAAAQRAVEANAARLGLQVLFSEREVFDAELDVRSGAEVVRFAFSPSRGCAREVSEAAVRKLAAP